MYLIIGSTLSLEVMPLNMTFGFGASNIYASNKYLASNFFKNLNAIQGWGRGDFRTVRAKYFAKCATKSVEDF